MIKDSGERTEFETGAVRDMQEGKGRFDLLPWYAIHEVAKHCEEGAKKYGERNVDKGIPQHSLIDSAIRHLSRYIHGEKDEPHLRAAAWNLLWALEQETTRPELNDLPHGVNTVESSLMMKVGGWIFEPTETGLSFRKDGNEHFAEITLDSFETMYEMIYDLATMRGIVGGAEE